MEWYNVHFASLVCILQMHHLLHLARIARVGTIYRYKVNRVVRNVYLAESKQFPVKLIVLDVDYTYLRMYLHRLTVQNVQMVGFLLDKVVLNAKNAAPANFLKYQEHRVNSVFQAITPVILQQ